MKVLKPYSMLVPRFIFQESPTDPDEDPYLYGQVDTNPLDLDYTLGRKIERVLSSDQRNAMREEMESIVQIPYDQRTPVQQEQFCFLDARLKGIDHGSAHVYARTLQTPYEERDPADQALTELVMRKMENRK